MSRYNHHFANHFSGCLLLAHAHDPYRNRDVQLRQLPGEFDVVGVTDGTDAWIAPVAGDPFSVSVKRILEDLRAGKMPNPRQPLQRRERKQLQPPEPVQVTPPARARHQLIKHA